MSRSWLREVGQNVKTAREDAGLRQDQLGPSPTTVVKLERGGGANLSVVERIAKTLNLDPSSLFLTYPVRSQGDHAVFLTEVMRMFSDPTRRRLVHFLGTVKDEHLAHLEKHVKAWKEPDAEPRARGQLQSPRRR